MTKEQILQNYQPIPYCGCWIWRSALAGTGYGYVFYEGKVQRVHRLVYGWLKGEIPEGMCVCHTCDTRSCINPDHLFLGTQKDNIQDAAAKGRIGKLIRGEKHRSAKLTEKDVRQIRELLARNIPQAEIASQYGVRSQSISSIKTGQKWGWLDGPEWRASQ